MEYRGKYQTERYDRRKPALSTWGKPASDKHFCNSHLTEPAAPLFIIAGILLYFDPKSAERPDL